MASKRKNSRTTVQRRAAPSLTADFVAFFHDLAKTLFDPYRPELHYMRGPGPKWHAKHRAAPAASFDGIPALVRIKAR
jgi:hypothetical protein